MCVLRNVSTRSVFAVFCTLLCTLSDILTIKTGDEIHSRESLLSVTGACVFILSCLKPGRVIPRKGQQGADGCAVNENPKRVVPPLGVTRSHPESLTYSFFTRLKAVTRYRSSQNGFWQL